MIKRILCMIFLVGLITGCSRLTKDLQQTETNSFFFEETVTSVRYDGSFTFDEWVKQPVTMYIEEIERLDQGNVYQFQLEKAEGIPEDKLTLGYFYVQKDKIYLMPAATKYLERLEKGEIPAEAEVVCQDKETGDQQETEAGRIWHHGIKAEGCQRIYYEYADGEGTNYYCRIVWEKDKGMISYKSGYGAERDGIELTNLRETKN